MRYALALYCSDLTDSSKKVIPVGILVVDGAAQKYAFKYLDRFSSIQRADPITKAIWDTIPEIIEQRFEDYYKNPNREPCRKAAGEYHGFISQMIDEWAQCSISFSESMPLEGNEDIEKRMQILFQEKVLRDLQ